MSEITFKKVGPGWYETTRQVELTHLDGRKETVPCVCSVHLRDDEIQGWNLCMEVKRSDGTTFELTNYDEVYPTKKAISKMLSRGTLDRWEKQLNLGWCI